MNNKIKADSIIFDLDGTLWNSIEGLTVAWDSYGRRFGFPGVFTQERMSAIMGFTGIEVEDYFRPMLGSRTEEVIAICLAEADAQLTKEGVKFYPQIEETLDNLSRRKPLFLVSNCKTGYLEAFLEMSGCRRYFTDWACEGSTDLPKAENIVRMVKLHGLQSAVYVGDTIKDENSSRKAGVQFIHAAYGFGSAAAPDAVIKRLADLPGIIE